ncbi:alpha/beta fold hydrolase [Streptomyces sp. NPDC003247]|uniref:alpha/beta fold hydrolase n=1 Tax=Streptomyces sp. NPDC003247 TaxID=3364677 RepID=UPI0036BF6D68
MSHTRESRWYGGEPVATPGGTLTRGQVHVEHLVPGQPNGEEPVVLVHGGGGQGLDWLATPDGRPGWAPLLADQGYHVYVVDRVAHGRSPYDPALLGDLGAAMPAEAVAGLFYPPAEGEGSHPTSGLHTRWPGGRTADDPVNQQFLAGLGPLLADQGLAQRLDQRALAALLDDIGPAVVFAHSAGGPAGFLVADARPELVRVLVACEPLGPPFLGAPGLPLSWGLTQAPVTYDPPAAGPAEIATVRREVPGPVPLVLQAEPARRLANIARVPVVLVTAEASPFRWFEQHLSAYLTQAGCAVDTVRLWEHGQSGNGHGFMAELNNAEILGILLDRIAAVRETKTKGRP